MFPNLSIAAWLSNDMKAAASRSNVWWQDSPFYRLFLVPFLTLMPLWIRLMQCLRRSVESGQHWPHMANALKYTSAIAVISYGTFRPHLRGNSLWIASFVGDTLLWPTSSYPFDLDQHTLVIYTNTPLDLPSTYASVQTNTLFCFNETIALLDLPSTHPLDLHISNNKYSSPIHLPTPFSTIIPSM